MKPSGETDLQPLLDAEAVLDQVETGVVVTDRQGRLRYANAFAVALFGFPDDAAHLANRSLVSLGFEEGDAGKAQSLASQVLGGRGWEGAFASLRMDGSRVFVSARAAPLRDLSGEITGIVIMAREAARRDSQRASDRIALLERIGERLAGSLEPRW